MPSSSETATMASMEHGSDSVELAHMSPTLNAENDAPRNHETNMSIVREEDENITYPGGPKLWMIIASLLMSSLLSGLDATMVTAVVPSLTNYFKTVEDIGWYSAVSGLVGSASIFIASLQMIPTLLYQAHISWYHSQMLMIILGSWSKSYSLLPHRLKRIYLASLFISLLANVISASSPTSTIFIIGRSLSGLASAGIKSGTWIIVTYSFPNAKRPFWTSLVNLVQMSASVAAPLVGGSLIDSPLGWRACFGLNSVLGVIAMGMVWWGFTGPEIAGDHRGRTTSWKEILVRLDPWGSLVFIPCIVSLLLALQWGGMTYGWDGWRIITLFVVFAVLLIAFAWLQHRRQDQAMLPPRVLKNRNVLGAAWVATTTNTSIAVTEYYFTIYFQGVRGFTAFRSGYLMVPMIIGMSLTGFVAGSGTTWIGYYMPFMVASAFLAPVASGLLTTFDVSTNLPKVLSLLGFLGIAIGFGIPGPISAINTVLPTRDVVIGVGIAQFGVRLGSSLFLSSSATLFRNRLVEELSRTAPGFNATVLSQAGLNDVRAVIGEARLGEVLLGYDKAVMQTLYLPTALASLTIVGCAVMESRSVKKKQE